MKKSILTVIACLTALAALAAFTACKPADKPAANAAAFHIGILTETVSQAEDDLRGAEELIRLYGRVSEGGIIQHVTYPDNFMDQQEVFISQVTTMADDPLMKAIIVNNAIPGTAEAFKRVKERRPDIICIAAEAHEDPLVIQQSADLATNADFISRGYLIPWAAKELGARTFVHISFPRHMSYESLGLRRQIMEEACKDLGLRFVFETAPDPTSDVGVAGAQQFILEKTPQWIQQYGTDTVFFCTNDAHTEPLLRQLLQYGGMFVGFDPADYTLTVTFLEDPDTVRSITDFRFTTALNYGIRYTAMGEIAGAGDTGTVTVRVHYTGTLPAVLSPSFVSPGTVSVEGAAQTSGSSSHDFTQDLYYKVVSKDGSLTRTYRVTVNFVNEADSRPRIEAFTFTAADNPGLSAGASALIDHGAGLIVIEAVYDAEPAPFTLIPRFSAFIF